MLFYFRCPKCCTWTTLHPQIQTKSLLQRQQPAQSLQGRRFVLSPLHQHHKWGLPQGLEGVAAQAEVPSGKSSLLSLPKVLPHVLLPRPGPDTAVSRFHSARGERGAGSTAQLCRTAGGGRKHLPPELHCIAGQGCVHEGSESKLRALIAASNYSHSTNLTALRTKSVMTFCKIMIIQSVSENVPHYLDMF